MRKKKWLAIMMALTMMAGCLSGCGGAEEGQQEVSGGVDETAARKEEASAEQIGRASCRERV